MSDPFLGQITLMGFNFAVRSWAFCEGQLIAINQNQSLFSLLGTIYGGDGRTTFALPDLRGRVAIHKGNGPGLSDYRQGTKGGVETVTLNTNQIPSHNHQVKSTREEGTQFGPGDKYLAGGKGDESIYLETLTDQGDIRMMAQDMIQNTGGNQAHTNIQPFLVVTYQIAMQGIFPSRN